jgi:large subunit ribosomal protein L18
MKLSPKYIMQFKRRRIGKTNYEKRFKLVSSDKPRLVIRRTLNYITFQIIKFDAKGDVTLVAVSSKELKKYNWKFSCDNLPASYLTGLLIAKMAEKKKISEVILDSGLYNSTKGNRIYAGLKGAIDGGLKIPVGEGIFPTEDRLKGKHISESVVKEFDIIKKKILSG